MESEFEHEKAPQVNLALCAVRRYVMMVGLKWLPLSSMRVLILRLCGAKVGKGCYIGFNLRIDTNYTSKILIGDHVTISHDVSIYAHTATPAKSKLGAHYSVVKEISIGDGAWIGAAALLLPGSRVEENSMIGAGSVFSGQTRSGGIYAGNPAKQIKHINF